MTCIGHDSHYVMSPTRSTLPVEGCEFLRSPMPACNAVSIQDINKDVGQICMPSGTPLAFWCSRPVAWMAWVDRFLGVRLGGNHFDLDTSRVCSTETSLSFRPLPASFVSELRGDHFDHLLHLDEQSGGSGRCQCFESRWDHINKHNLHSVTLRQWELCATHSGVNLGSHAKEWTLGDNCRGWCQLATSHVVCTSHCEITPRTVENSEVDGASPIIAWFSTATLCPLTKAALRYSTSNLVKYTDSTHLGHDHGALTWMCNNIFPKLLDRPSPSRLFRVVFHAWRDSEVTCNA